MKAHSMTEVEEIILAFGINHKNQKTKETAIKQMQKALKAAHDKFPRARVWVPLIYCSNALKWDEQLALRTLNDHIKRNLDHIPALPAKDFLVSAGPHPQQGPCWPIRPRL